jgi:SAM-dependent methyltransferase
MDVTTVGKITTPAKGGSFKWRMISLLMRTIGRTSSGIALGYRYGFDSGVMLDKVYENRPSGRYLIGTVIDWFYLRAIGWRAIRARRQLLKSILLQQIEELALPKGDARRSGNGKPERLVLLDVAAGPGRYLLELCERIRASGRNVEEEIAIICRDLSEEGLEKGKLLAQSLGLNNVRYETGDAVDHASLDTVEPKPHIVVVSGLYELFTDAATIKQSMAGIYRILRPGGRLVFTTQVAHPQLELIANVLVNRHGEPWIMTCRSIGEVEALAAEAGFWVRKSEKEPLGLFAVTVCEKTEIGG